VRRFFYAAGTLDEATAAPDAYASASSNDDEEAALTRLDRAIAALPRQLKEPLLLTAFEGLSQAAAGEALGISAKAVETRMYRARKLLAEALNAGGPDSEES
jgi:RNA polymerase sigma factor CnrH